jgi:hypothetical protein
MTNKSESETNKSPSERNISKRRRVVMDWSKRALMEPFAPVSWVG